MSVAVPSRAPSVLGESRHDVPTVLVLGHVKVPEALDAANAVQATKALDVLETLYHASGEVRPTLIVSLLDLPQKYEAIVRAAKRVRPDVDVLLASCEGRPALFGQLVLHGANGMIGPAGEIHRFDGPSRPATPSPPVADTSAIDPDTFGTGLLSPEELAALLADDDDTA